MTLNAETVLVTGGAGAIGGNLVVALLDTCKRIVVIDDCSSGRESNLPASDKIIFHKDTIVNDDLLREVFREEIDIVFHLAANFANQNSVDFPRKDLDVNGFGTLKLLEAARDAKVRRFLYTSSSCVYGHREELLREDITDFSLDTPYAITKLLGERYTTFFNRHYGLPTTIVRYFNTYGPGEYPGKYRNVIPNFMQLAVRGQPLPITGTGDETRDFTYVGDNVACTIALAGCERAGGEIFNIGSGRETRIVDMAKAINDITGNPAGVEFRPPRNWDSVKTRRADISKAREIVGYAPATTLEDGLRTLYQWFKDKNIR